MTQEVLQQAGVTAMLLAAVVATSSQRPAKAESKPAAPVIFYASQSGRSTLDQGEGGGNPFASALIEALERPSLAYAEFRTDLIALTKEKSRGFQEPDASTSVDSTQWRVEPISAPCKRVALVFVYSNYGNAGVTSLPGAKRDLVWVAAALKSAGFDVQVAIDPTQNDLRVALDALSRRSQNAEAAIIYLTGHGFEHRGQVYLMPNDYPFEEGSKRLSELAVHVPSLVGYLKARSATLCFLADAEPMCEARRPTMRVAGLTLALPEKVIFMSELGKSRISKRRTDNEMQSQSASEAGHSSSEKTKKRPPTPAVERTDTAQKARRPAAHRHPVRQTTHIT